MKTAWRLSSLLSAAIGLAGSLFVTNASNAGAASRDQRRKLVLLLADAHAGAGNAVLPEFAAKFFARDFRVVAVTCPAGPGENAFDHIEEIADADLLLVSVDRRVPPKTQLAAIRRYVAAGKPVVGIRRASHAFAPSQGQKLPAGAAAWPEWDVEVIGCHYAGGHRPDPVVAITPAQSGHPLLRGVTFPFTFGSVLYKVRPLVPGTDPILIGTVPNQPAEPVAWTFTRKDGGRTFYTSMGIEADFANPAFIAVLENGIRWAAGMPAAR